MSAFASGLACLVVLVLLDIGSAITNAADGTLLPARSATDASEVHFAVARYAFFDEQLAPHSPAARRCSVNTVQMTPRE